MFDRYYCIKSFCHLKTLKKNLRKVHFCIYYNGAQKHEGFVGFENACYRAKAYIILKSLNYVHIYAPYCWWCQLLSQPKMYIYVKYKSMWIAWLIHRFLPIKTWLLIACDTAFYGIISLKKHFFCLWEWLCFTQVLLYSSPQCSWYQNIMCWLNFYMKQSWPIFF